MAATAASAVLTIGSTCLPVLTIFLAALCQGWKWTRWQTEKYYIWLAAQVLLSLVIAALPPHSILAAVWRPLSLSLARWPSFLQWLLLEMNRRRKKLSGESAAAAAATTTTRTDHSTTKESAASAPRITIAGQTIDFSILQQGGPLGPGCYKLVEVVAGLILWKWTEHRWPPTLTFFVGSSSSSSSSSHSTTSILMLLVAVLVFSAAVNGVLWLWSLYAHHHHHDHHSTNTPRRIRRHQGVHQLIQPTIGRRLFYSEHVQLLVWAIANSTCEEITSRVLWRLEFQRAGLVVELPWSSNVAQALVFGLWHYHGGIPNGMLGVILCFVYGLLLGALADYGGTGLALPIFTHTLADYFIFATIARGKMATDDSDDDNKSD